MSLNTNDGEKDFQELVLFVRAQLREYKRSITRETSIENDLGVTGDDAGELLSAFRDKFKVNLSKFNFEKYFNDEPSSFTYAGKLLPFAVGHLEKAVIAGRLDDDIINGRHNAHDT